MVGKTQDHPIILFHKFKFNFHMFTWLKMKGNQKNILKIYDRKRVEISLVFSIAINLWTELFNSRTFNGLQFHFSRSSIWTNGWSILVYRSSPIQGTYGKWMVWLIVFYVWKCLEKIMPSLRLLHKLSPNWPRAGNSSGSISDQALLAAWIYSLFGKVKVIYKHYQKPFPMQPWLRVLPERSKIHCGEKSQQKCRFLNLHNSEMSVEACIRQWSSSMLIHNILLEFR